MTAPLKALGPRLTPEVVLEAGLGQWYGRPVRIVTLKTAPMDGFSTNPVARLEVTLDTGERLPVVFKRLLCKAARDVALEVRLYQGVLANQRFNAPALYGAVSDDASGAYWLFLEDVGDWRLEYCETEDWEAAFRWLAGLHAAFHGQDAALVSMGYLPEHDADFYRTLARLARQTLARRGAPESLTRFDRLMARGLERAIAELGGVPRTLIHGDFFCHNLMVQPGGRIRPIDWEWAAIGVPAWDLVRLLDGWGDERQRFLDAYFDEIACQATEVNRVSFERSMSHCKVMLKLWRIRWWARACHAPGGVDRLLAGIEAVWDGKESEGADA